MGTESSTENPVDAVDDRTEDTLGELILRVAGGDDAALGALYDQSIGKVYALAFAITRVHEEAEEVACDVYTQVWARACDFSTGRGSGMAWLMTICRSRSLDKIRRKKSRIGDGVLDPADPDETASSLPGPDMTLYRLQQNAEITQALDALTQPQRDAVMLTYFRGSTQGDIAAALDLPLGTVKSHLRRALQSLQNGLELLP